MTAPHAPVLLDEVIDEARVGTCVALAERFVSDEGFKVHCFRSSS